MNKVFVYGRLYSDPEIKEYNGRNVASFGIASQNKNVIDKTKKEYGTNFYRVSVWGPSAESAAKYLHKGNRVVVCGDLVVREYTGNDGIKHTAVEINNAEYDLVETKAESEAKQTSSAAPVVTTTPATVQNFTPVETDELPF